MAQITITINSREYSLACEDGQEERIITLSKILDSKAKEITSAIGHINENLLLAMVGILVADDLSNNKTSNSNIDLEKIDEDFSVKINETTAKLNSIIMSIK